MSWRCRHCTNKQIVSIEGKLFVYCNKRENFPSPRFVEAWGCDDYEDQQLDLFYKEKGGRSHGD